ncbi:methionine biosynthesis protein MetW [Candidatus Latescibacterota bacterium]
MVQELNMLMRADRDIITSIIPENSNVLDLGCGDGDLLAELKKKKGVTGRGVDIDEENLITGIERGLSVYMGDLDEGLTDYPDKMYDYVILNQTLQVIKKPAKVMKEMLRVGNYALVGFPNFGNWYLRLYLLFSGRLPKSKALPFEWHNTPNIHPLTVLDFKSFCKNENIKIIDENYLIFGKWRNSAFLRPFTNLFAVTAMFVLKGKNINKEK